MTFIPKQTTYAEEVEETIAGAMCIFLAVLLCTYLLVQRLSSSAKWFWVPSSLIYVLAGMLAFGLQKIFFGRYDPKFDAMLFFLGLLPPVIFNSGLEINIPLFFHNYTSILLFANVGTIINAVVVGLFVFSAGAVGASSFLNIFESLSFGSIVSATDPVTTIAVFDRLHVEPNLYTIIVGVSVLDDAISVILCDMFNEFITGDRMTGTAFVECIVLFVVKMYGSMVFGYALGVIFAHAIHWEIVRENTALLATFTVLFLYGIFSLSDAVYLSGIITTMLAGISFQKTCKAYYSLGEASSNAQREMESSPSPFQTVRALINGWAFFFESLVFVYIGLTLFHRTSNSASEHAFTFWALVGCLIGRVAQIYPLSYLLNMYHAGSFTPLGHERLQEDVTHQEQDTALSSEQTPQQRTGLNGWFSSVLSSSSSVLSPILLDNSVQHMMMLAGLRGPIAYATAQLFPDDFQHASTVVVATSVIVVVTTGFFGALTMPALKYLRIPHSPESGDACNNAAAPFSHSDVDSIVPWYLRLADAFAQKALRGCDCFMLSVPNIAAKSPHSNDDVVLNDLAPPLVHDRDCDLDPQIDEESL